MSAPHIEKRAATIDRLTGFQRFGTQVRGQAYARLGSVALVLVAVSALALVIEWISPGARAPIGNMHPIGRAVLLVGAAAVFLACRAGRPSPERFLGFAIAFEVLVGATFATQVLDWQSLLGEAGWPLGGGLATGIWVMLYAALVPIPARRHLLGALVAGAFVPLFFFLSLVWYPGEPRVPVKTAFLQLHLGTGICVVLAWVIARIVYSLSKELSEAREMGSYKLMEKLGAGGMGEVWLADHRMLARPAAIKLIRPDAIGDDVSKTRSAVRRFEKEVQATASLRSPHTVEIYDYGVADDGAFYYVMEALDGMDLDELVRERGPQPVGRVIHILRQVCHSLGEAHEEGLIHRDVKPANIFLCRYGRDLDHVKVLDFGLVKEGDGKVDATQGGGFAGTPTCAPPEQIRGVRDEMGPQTDVYALAGVAYWLLTGRYAFDESNAMAMIMAHMQQEPMPASTYAEGIPPELDRLLLDCLEKSPAERPESMDAVAQRLAPMAAGHPWTPGDARARWTAQPVSENGEPD